MVSVTLNAPAFWNRVGKILDAWVEGPNQPDWAPLGELDALLVLSGESPTEDEPVRKSTAFQSWLLGGYEFPNSMILIQRDAITMISSPSQAQILQQLSVDGAILPIKVIARARAKEPPNNAMPELLEKMASSKRIGLAIKEKHTGKLVDEWEKLLAEPGRKEQFEFIECGPILSSAMASKDEDELKLVRTASHLASALLAHSFVPKLETILDNQSKIAHIRLADYIENRLGAPDGSKGPDMRVFNKSKHLGPDVDYSMVEVTYTPIIQSRNTKTGYDLKPSATSSEDNMAVSGVILSSIGVKYKAYCAQVGRSFLVDPTKEQDQNYTFLLSLQQELLSKMHDGAVAKDVYATAVDYIKAKMPHLEKHFVKTIGFGMGIEFRDSSWLLNAKNTRTLRSDMIFSLSIGFQDLEDKEGKKYAIGLTDTVKVTANSSVCLTEGSKTPTEYIFRFEDEPKEKASSSKAPNKSDKKAVKADPDASPKTKPLNGVTVGSKILRGKTRQQLLDPEASKSVQAKIADHQRELHAQRQQEGLARHAGEDGTNTEDNRKTWKRFQSYKGEAGLPKEAESLRIHVDRRNQTIVVPINGFAVPFHINTLKTCSKSDEGEYTILRLNFQIPGSHAGKKEDAPFEDPDATFIKSLVYRSTDGNRFEALNKAISDLRKEATKRENEQKEMADVVQQDNLVEIRGRKPLRLPDVFARPALDGKRLAGELEIHSNGVRYISPLGGKIDLLFSNIKHLFFQPCDGEMLVIIHFHLKSPIMIGKKKTKDVQVYREASDVQFDETGNRKRKYRYGDEDEIELEQSELKRRKQLNREFKHFAEKIAEASDDQLEVDIPFRELAFEGVPYRTNVKLQPTTECIVHLSDPPFFVVTLSDIEVASLERVQFSLKQFDMVLIFRDFNRPPIQINSIPSSQLDNVREWLDSVEVPVGENAVNLNWSQIMKTINDSPYEFFKDGGWAFLTGGNASDVEEEEVGEEESEFDADAADFASSSSETDSTEYSDASDDSDEDFGAGSGSESEGQDWDELERRAARADQKRKEEKGGFDSDDSARPKKKPAKANAKSRR
ncbi:FACT complex subunit SPT16 [Cantharellus anzutake]|uniref:FACT complex subunit SPT16 n=1 Tax=Cantharellus anzutake TaxID=1750568 RepID=UPI001908B114|nr:FACT complex subunit SPT16 [Cantharellus anzutake]KAF8337624.1 FACT complex subunit SPT16 [Cantharellus anzutake]